MNNSSLRKATSDRVTGDRSPSGTNKMGKLQTLRFIRNLIFIIVFNAIFFIVGGTEHGFPVWISYAFIHFAYIVVIITPALIRKGKSVAVFGATLYGISTVYFIIALATGVTFILINPEGFEVAFLVQLILAGLYAILLVMNMISNERTADEEEKRAGEISFVKNATLQLRKITSRAKSEEIIKKTEKVYDVVSSSPVKSHENLAQLEMRMLTLVDELDKAVSEDNMQYAQSLAEALLAAAADRNNKLKMLN